MKRDLGISRKGKSNGVATTRRLAHSPEASEKKGSWENMTGETRRKTGTGTCMGTGTDTGT